MLFFAFFKYPTVNITFCNEEKYTLQKFAPNFVISFLHIFISTPYLSQESFICVCWMNEKNSACQGFTVCWTLSYKSKQEKGRQPFLENLKSDGRGDMQVVTECCDRGANCHKDRDEEGVPDSISLSPVFGVKVLWNCKAQCLRMIQP